MFKKLKLEAKFILSTISIVLAVLAVNFLLFMRGYDNHSDNLIAQITDNYQGKAESYAKQKGIAYAELLSKQLFDPLYADNISQTYRKIKTTLSQPDVSHIHVIDPDGMIIHDGTDELLQFGSIHPQAHIAERALIENRPIVNLSTNHLFVVHPIRQSDITLGSVYIEISLKTLQEQKASNIAQMSLINKSDKQDMMGLQIVISVLAVAIGCVMAFTACRSLTSPIKRLSAHFKLSSNQAMPVTDIDRQDEIGELVTAYNHMTDQVNTYTSEVEFMAFHDKLTGLPNRDKLTLHLDQQLKELDGSLAVLALDLDDFKHINDNYGHSVGDELLIQLGKLLDDLVHQTLPDHGEKIIVSRIGADEFVVVFPFKSQEQLRLIADLIKLRVSQPFNVSDKNLDVLTSIGVVSHPDFGNDSESLLHLASLALQQAKRSGKDKVLVYDEELHQKTNQRIYIERELRNAIHNAEQFELWYQPKFNLANNQLIGAEALVRWKHPEKGYIRPDEFIPLAEKNDMILAIGEHLIRLAIKQRSEWTGHFGDHFHIGLNLSPRQIYRQNLQKLFESNLAKYNLSPRMIQVEVTESLLMDDTEKANHVLQSLHNTGIEVWLDDFGTGYSSLSYLQKVKFDGIKIDRSFVSDIEPNCDDQSLLKTIISMGHNLGMKVVAEGIETEQQAKLLNDLGCDIGQGYHLGRPIPADEFIEQFSLQTKIAS